MGPEGTSLEILNPEAQPSAWKNIQIDELQLVVRSEVMQDEIGSSAMDLCSILNVFR